MMKVKVGRPLIDLLKLCYDARRPILLIGQHGIGKSESLEEAASELGVHFVSRDLSLMEPPDLVGLPKADGAVTRFLPPSFLPNDGKGIIVFEELNRCPSYMRAPCLQLLTARSLNDYTLPPGWLPAAAINPSDSGYDVSELDPALLSRFVQAIVEADQQHWVAWARTNAIHPDVIDYVSSDAEIFDSPQSNPRAWKYVSDLLYADGTAHAGLETLRVAVAGLIGVKRAAAFLGCLRTRVRPLKAEDVLSAYGTHRRQIQALVKGGKLDLVRGTLLDIQKHLQARHHFEETRDNPKRWRHLRDFIKDLPGDLREQARKFFEMRGYTWPK